MPDRATIEADYHARLGERRATLAARERTHALLAYLRLAVFGSALAILFVGGTDAVVWLLVPLGAFVVLAVAHARLLNARDRAASAVGFYERGLARLADLWIGHGRDGRHLQPAQHVYSEDLDIFGRGSIFELLATTRTHAGEETLARWLLAPAPPDVVQSRQAAVRELSALIDLREGVAVLGDQLGIGVHADLLRRWSATPITLRGLGTRLGLFAIAATTVGSLILWASSGRGGLILLISTVVQLAIAAFFKARVSSVIEAVEEPAHDLDLLADLLRVIEQGRFDAPHLRGLQQQIARSGRTASAEIARLAQLEALLSSRHNVLFAIPAGMVMWSTQWAFAIEAWRLRAGVHIPTWLDVVGEFEALLALATFAAEHPGFVFPSISTGTSTLEAVDAAHPALPPSAVPNSLSLAATGPSPSLLIVSGSNMSGKSTLMRALGVNVVLAQAGAPVRARAFRMSPLHIGAAIRVQDSLTDGRSRFFAEITRLKEVVDLASRYDGQVLFLFDEILGGTNSHDRRIGSEALLSGLVQKGTIGLVTTHDLALGEIAAKLPGRADNVHFEDRFEGGTLVFDYCLRPGIVRTSNAIALMQSIGLLEK